MTIPSKITDSVDFFFRGQVAVQGERGKVCRQIYSILILFLLSLTYMLERFDRVLW